MTWAALGLTVVGWGVVWARGLALIGFVPVWVAAVVFFVGLALIPLCPCIAGEAGTKRPAMRLYRKSLGLMAVAGAMAGLTGSAAAATDGQSNAPGQWSPAQIRLVQATAGSSAIGAGGASADLQSLSQDPKQWPMAPHDYANTRFSALDKINPGNVSKLALAWSFSVGADRGQEAAPLVVDNTMYVVAPYFGVHPNEVLALDATTGDLKWAYAPKPNPAAMGVAYCDVVNRGLAYDNGKILLSTLDDHMVAIDAKDGKEIWVASLGSIATGETLIAAPFVVKGKVLQGNSGGELGVHGWLNAVDENTGKIAWRAYATGPDKDVLIGSDFKPYYKSDQGKDLGVKSWPADAWKIGGGTMWGWIQYDPQLKLIYYGTGNPGPWNNNQRPGDNKWTATEFARDPDTGMAKWAYQYTPHDVFDYDEINESILIDLPINGQTRKTLVHIGRNGYIYVMDRTTREVYSATGYDTINATKGIDIKTGLPIRNPDKLPSLGKTVTEVCPNADGAKDWQPSVWSPRTHLVYVPHQHLCMNWQTSEVGYIAGTPFVGATVDMYAGPGGYRGEYMAWDPVKQKKCGQSRKIFRCGAAPS